jgi:hypothetical protein
MQLLVGFLTRSLQDHGYDQLSTIPASCTLKQHEAPFAAIQLAAWEPVACSGKRSVFTALASGGPLSQETTRVVVKVGRESDIIAEVGGPTWKVTWI